MRPILSLFDIKRALSVVGTIAYCILFLSVLNMVMEHNAAQKAPGKSGHVASVTVGGAAVWVGVADTQEAREQGLSGTAKLAPNTGMLFVFEQRGMWGFWMKDMSYPIDIIWADESGKVITVAQNVSPKSYPEAFYPLSPALYVLELPAGFCAEHHVVEGNKITIPKRL